MNYVLWKQDSKVAGIPCQVHVFTCDYIKPDRNTWASDIDYNGGCVVEYEIRDRRGYKALWLTSKMKPADFERIDREVTEYCTGQ